MPVISHSIAWKENLKSKLSIVFGVVAVIWFVELIDFIMPDSILNWGIYPRTLSGLIGIPLSPFRHASIYHALVNTLPFIILGGLVASRGVSYFVQISLLIMVIGGVFVWLFGRSSYHVGASGLIFGYFGFLVFRGYFERSFTAILMAVFTVILYGSMIAGIWSIRTGISWESHLFGLLAGILIAKLFSEKQDKNMNVL